MPRLFRRLLAAAAVAVGLAAPARAAEVDPLLPADTESVVFVNVKQVLESDLFKKYALNQLKQALEGQEAQKMVKTLGLDPLKDIDRVTGGLWGKDAQDMTGVFVVRGRFDPEKLFKAAEEAAKKDGDKVAIVKDGKYTMVKFTPDNQPKPFYVAVADEKTVIGGSDKELVSKTMQAAEGNAKPALKKELAQLVVQQDEKASLWVCGLSDPSKIGDIPAAPPFIEDGAKLKKQLQSLLTMSMTLRVSADVSLDILMGMKDTDSADDFGASIDDLLTKAKGFLPFLAGNKPEMKPLVDQLSKNLKSKVKDKEVMITLKISGESIAKAAKQED